MLDNLFLYFGSESSNFPIMQFCKAYPNILEKQKLHHIAVSDILPEYAYSSPLDTFHDDWIYCDSFYKKYIKNMQSLEEIFPHIKKQIEKKNIKNLLIILNFNTLSIYIDELIKYCKLLNAKNIAVSYSKINIIHTFNAKYNIQLLNLKNINLIPSIYNSYHLYHNKNIENEKLLKIFAKQWNIQIEERTYNNEEECFYDFIKQHQLSVPKQSSFIPQAAFSPHVLAFLLALHENTTFETTIDLAHEFDFLYHFSKENTFFSYCPKAFAALQNTQTHTICENTILDCSKTGLKVELGSALTLAQKISSKTRQLLLKDVTLAQIEVMSANCKTVYSALMYAENKISLNEVKTLLSSSKNTSITAEQAGNAPILTIYTASYNSKKYIKQCIESIAAQKTNYPFIHLISDDNSTDGTQELLREYAQKYPHIQLILRSRNYILGNYTGILNSLSTKYVAVCDADDFYTDEKKIEKQINFLEENPDCNICFHPAYVYYEKDNLIKNIHPNSVQNFVPKKFYYLSNIITTNLMQSSSVMFRWKWTKGITSETPLGLTPLDWALNITHAHNSKIGFINEPMSLYRRHEKAFYALTETNIPLHLITNCYSELQFIESLNLYTERKYEKLFLQKAFLILYNFYVTAKEIEYDKEKYNNIQKNIELYFPEYIKYFKDNLSKIK